MTVNTLALTDAETAAKILLEIIEELGDDYVYEPVKLAHKAAAYCVNFDPATGESSCIVGKWVERVAPEHFAESVMRCSMDASASDYEENPAGFLASLGLEALVVDEVIALLDLAQEEQDTGRAYGDVEIAIIEWVQDYRAEQDEAAYESTRDRVEDLEVD